MPSAIHASVGVLEEHTILIVLLPSSILHWIIAHKLQHADTVERRINSRSRIKHEILPGMGIRELLWSFVGSETDRSAVWDLFPWVVGDGDHAALQE